MKIDVMIGFDRKWIRWWIPLAAALFACAGQPSPEVAPQEEPTEHTIVSGNLPTIQFTIQVGAFSTTLRAAQYAELLQAKGLDAYYFVDIDGLSKVRFERFGTKAAATKRAAELKARGWIEGFYIVKPGPGPPTTDSQHELREQIVRTALRFEGTSYRWGGESAQTGFDCSGLTMTVYRLNGLELPRSASSQYRAGDPVGRDGIQRGDLVFFATGRGGRISHVGIYRGNGQFIHAPGRGKSIRTSSLSNTYFKTRFKGARRYF